MTGQVIRILAGHTGGISAVACVSPSIVLSSAFKGSESTVRRWDAVKGECLSIYHFASSVTMIVMLSHQMFACSNQGDDFSIKI